MIRGFWLVLPLVLVVGLDGAFTFLGQPAAYRSGHYDTVNEESQLGTYFLQMGPKPYALGIAGLAGLYVLLAALLPRFLGQTLFGSALLGHAWGSSSWVPGIGRRYLFGPGGPLESLGGSPNTDYYVTLAYFVVLAAITVFCWRIGGLLPAAPAPKPGKDAKKDKDKD